MQEQHHEFEEEVQPPEDSTCWGFLQKTEFFSRCLNKNTNVESRREYKSIADLEAGDGDIGAGHVGRYISLANPDALSKAMCSLPLAIIVTIFLCTVLSVAFWTPGFWIIFALANVQMYIFCVHLGFGTIYGIFKMRAAAKENWGRRWEDFLLKHPGMDEGMLHIVILPNYSEDEEMLSQTISNLAESDMAKKYMVVVLAMEAREGDAGREKAERLVHRHKAEFKEIFPTFHPANIPCEVAGKSSNSQWAFREVQRWYGSHVSQSDDQHNSSKVFMTVADADSLHHRDYWTKLSIEGLALPESERTWSIWQAPILNLRNYETVPNLVRVTSYGTFLYEISGLATAHWSNHPCFSAYSMTLALANHPMVDGWDADVIAEDHHMFLKCMFASYWEEIFSTKQVSMPSKLQLRPVWLPVTSYLAEDSRGWWQSCYARFQQARRHSQGVAELSYLILQYMTICMEYSMPWRGHVQCNLLIAKLLTIHIWNGFHSVLSLAFSAYCAYWAATKVWKGDLQDQMVDATESINTAATGEPDALAYKQYQLILFVFLASFAPVIGIVFGLAQYLVVKDNVEGRYCPLYLQSVADPENANKKTNKLSIKESIQLYSKVMSDSLAFGQLMVILYGGFPLTLAAFSLARHGHKFEYIVAAKPDTQVKDKKAVDRGDVAPEELEVLADKA